MYSFIKKCILLPLLLTNLSCGSHYNAISVFEIVNHWEFSVNGKVEAFHNQIYLIHLDNYMILKEPYWREPSERSGGELPVIEYRYFVMKESDRNGMAYKSIDTEKGMNYPVDSLINDYLKTPSKFYNPNTLSKDSVAVVRDNLKGLTLEKITNSKTRPEDQDTCYFYYHDKKMGVNFYNASIRVKGLFLYKSKIIFAANEKGAIYNNSNMRRELLFEIKECPIFEKEKIEMLVQRFQTQQL